VRERESRHGMLRERWRVLGDTGDGGVRAESEKSAGGLNASEGTARVIERTLSGHVGPNVWGAFHETGITL
jgi:hypothetical protein